MEQDRINHVDGHRLSPFLIVHPSPSFQRETRSLKYLNGIRSAERAPVQVNGDIKGTPFRKGFDHMKSAQKNCISPTLSCAKKESATPLHNGAIKRISSESCVTGEEQTKKGRKYEDLNGGNVGAGNKQAGAPIAERKKREEKLYFKIRRSSRLTCGRYEYPEYEGKFQEDAMDSNYNSDPASPITNNTVALSNGANEITSSMESLHNELSQETLSHCDQELNCNIVQNHSPHTDAINSNSPLPTENVHSPHTSGQIISPNACNTELQHVPVIMAPEVHTTEKSSTPPAITKESPDHDSHRLPVECRNAQEAEDFALTGNLTCDDRIDLNISNHSRESPSGDSEGNYSVFKENPAFRKDVPTPPLPNSNSCESMPPEDYSYCNERGENHSEVKDGADRSQNSPGSPSPSILQRSPCFPPCLQDAFSNDSLLMLASLSALESLDSLRGSPEKILQRLQAPLNRDERQPHLTRNGTVSRTEDSPHPKMQKQLCSNAGDLTSQAHQKQGGDNVGGSSFSQMSNQDSHRSVIQSPIRADDHGLLGQHTASPGVLKHVEGQGIHRFEHTSQFYKNDVPKLRYPAAEDQGHTHIQKSSLHGQPQTTDSQSNTNTQPHHHQWSFDCSQQRQKVEQALNPQFKPQHLNPQIAEAESFLNACLSQKSQQTPDPCARERSAQVLDQRHIFRGKHGEKLPLTLSQTHIKSEPQTFSQIKLEEFINLEKQYTKPTQSQSHNQETGHEHSPHQNSRFSSYSPIPQPSNSHAQNPFSDSEKRETAVIRELFAYKKTPDPHQTSRYPNNKTPTSDAHSFFHGKEPQMDPGMVPPFLLQPKQEYGSLMPNLPIKRNDWSPHALLPQGMGTPPPTLDERGSNYPHLNSRKAIKKHSVLRTHLLHKLEQKKEISHSLLKPIKVEPSLHPISCNRSRTPTRTPEKKPGRKIKQEVQPFEPNNVKERSIIETMEQQLKQYQVKTLYGKKAHRSKSPKHVKVESSCSLTVLTAHARSTDHNGYPPGLDQQPTYPSEKTPTKRVSGSYLHNFLESPSTLFDTPIKSLLDTPAKTQYDFASCSCVDQIIEKDEGPYYTHLGAGPNISAVREIMEERFGEKGDAIRLERVVYTGKEGRSSQGCPIAKWVLRRSSKTEKVLCIVRERMGHSCETAVLVIAILVWEGIPRTLADSLYSELTETLPKYGAMTARRCALNEERTCACQGLDPDTCGASFSFGCSWSMYYNGCKFARSRVPRKFKLFGDDPKEETKLEANLQNLSTLMAPTYKKMAPDAYNNQIEHENRAQDCRLGLKEGRPFSGVTACLDFCAHAHRDVHNMQNGSTLVCTLTSEDNREIGKIPEDEQLHVLPLYRVSTMDEFGSVENQQKKMQNGAIQVLQSFRRKVRKHSEPVKTCRQKKLEAKKAAAERHAEKHGNLLNGSSKIEKEKPPRQKNSESAAQAKQLAELLQFSGPATEPQELKQSKNPASESTYQGTNSARYVRQPPTPDPYQSSPKAPDPYGGQHPTNMYSSPSRSSTSYLNSSSSMNTYSTPLNQSNQCPPFSYNGSLLSNGCPPPPYGAYTQHMDIYRCQSQAPHMLPYQNHYQQRYDHKYLNYGNQNAQADSLNGCSPGPNVHHSGSYSPYPSREADPSFMEAAPAVKSHQNNFPMDYSTVRKNGEYTPHASPYHAHGGPSFDAMYGGSPNAMHLQRKGNSNSVTDNGICNMLPAFNHDRTTPYHEGLIRTNGANVHENLPETPLKNQTHEEDEEEDGIWSDSEQSFLDSDIGGVAVAPAHGSILIECAKRELHATTPLKNPNRHHPTRISLVFYQHKSMNEPKHGLALWEAKMAEKAREKEEDCERYGPDYVAPKSGQKKIKREPVELLVQEPTEQNYMRFIKSLSQRTMSITTNSTSTSTPYAFTRVTGPYHRYI